MYAFSLECGNSTSFLFRPLSHENGFSSVSGCRKLNITSLTLSHTPDFLRIKLICGTITVKYRLKTQWFLNKGVNHFGHLFYLYLYMCRWCMDYLNKFRKIDWNGNFCSNHLPIFTCFRYFHFFHKKYKIINNYTK